MNILRGKPYDGRLVRRLQFPVGESVPVDATEECVLANLPLTRLTTAQALLRLLDEQLFCVKHSGTGRYGNVISVGLNMLYFAFDVNE